MKTIITYTIIGGENGRIEIIRVPHEKHYTDFTKAEVLLSQKYERLSWWKRDNLAKELLARAIGREDAGE